MAAIIAGSAVLVAIRSRKGGTRASVVACGVSGAVLIALATVPMPIVGWAFPSLWQLAFFFVGLQLLGTAVGLAGESPPGRVWPAMAIAIVSIASLGCGIARSRGKLDELALRYGSSCTRGQFSDSGERFDHRFFSSPYEVRTISKEGEHGESDCSLSIAGKSVPLYNGRTYDGTPLCTGGTVIVCGEKGILLVEDSKIDPWFFGDSRFRGFHLPALEPFEPKQNALATPIALEIIAAAALILALANWRRRSFAASATWSHRSSRGS